MERQRVSKCKWGRYRNSNHGSGFTLVELLVVIAIIAVLMSVLLPALGRARAAAARVTCASNMRQIAVATANYAQNFKGFLPPAVSSDFQPAASYNINNIKPLFDAKMLSSDKVRYCPTGPNGEFFGGRANYEFNPHPASVNANWKPAVYRWAKLQDIPKDRMLLMDVIYDRTTVSHFDPKGQPTWNVAFPDGHVVIVPQKDIYDALAGRPIGGLWTRLNDYVRVLELAATNQDPKMGTGNYLWGSDRYYPWVKPGQ